MASLICTSNGYKTIQYNCPIDDSKRPKISLGKMTRKQALSIKIHVEQLIAACRTGFSVDPGTQKWVRAQMSSNTNLICRLSQLGLIEAPQSLSLGQFLSDYINKRSDLKELTKRKLQTTKKYLVAHFGKTLPLGAITQGMADDFRLQLIGEGLSDNTVRKHSQICKQFFTDAVRHRLIDENPFADQPATGRPNPSRQYFVSREDASRLMNYCPDLEWKLIFALCRYGGLRCPSELVLLQWEHIDWATSRILVHSPKTEHHPNGATRIVPLFPELRDLLRDAFEIAEEGAVFVLPSYRSPSKNFRTRMLKIIKRAGLKPWPKLFQNLRSTRQTELEEEFPTHVVCSWMGNSESVARKNYLQVTEDHYDRAITMVQKRVQKTAEGGGNAPNQQEQALTINNAKTNKPRETRGLLITGAACATGAVAEEGLEPPTRGL